MIRRDRPAGGALRQALYDGDIFQLAPTEASLRLADEVEALLEASLGPDARSVHERLSNDQIFSRVGAIRRTLFLEPRFHEAVRAVLDALGLDASRCAFDPIRIRVVAHRGHENPLARAVYYPHRDTWYAHPQAAVAFWIPLADLRDEETFVFFPERFRSVVANDSERFDYDAWVRQGWDLKIGWQDKEAGARAHYPATLGELDGGAPVGFSCKRGENLLFAGAHYHRTLPQSTGRTRFSLDFRFVHLDDHARGLGAPNVDNRSRGSALPDYTQPPP